MACREAPAAIEAATRMDIKIDSVLEASKPISIPMQNDPNQTPGQNPVPK